MENQNKIEEYDKNVFDELSEDIESNENSIEMPETVEPEEDFEFGDLSESVKKEVILKDEDKDKIFTITSAELGKPLLKDVDGNSIPPKPFSDNDLTKKGYKTKLKVEVAEGNYILLIPNIKWYVGTRNGKKVLNPWFRTTGLKAEDLNDKFVAETSKVYYRYCLFKGVEPGKLSQADFVKGLIGCKIKVKQWAEKYKGEMCYKIDIAEFVK